MKKMRTAVCVLVLLGAGVPLAADYNSGVARFNARNYWGAVADFRAVLQANPGHMPSWAYLSSALYALGQYQQLVNEIPPAIKAGHIDLNNKQFAGNAFWILKNIGNACLQLGLNHKAIVSLNLANRVINTDHTVYNGLGLAYLRTGKFWQAEFFFQTAINLQPNNYFYLNNRGAALLQMQKYKEALACFEKAVRLNWNYQNGWENLWATREKLGLAANRGWKSLSYFASISDEEREKWKAQELARRRQWQQQQAALWRQRQAAQWRQKQEAERKRLEDLKRQQEEKRRQEALRKARQVQSSSAAARKKDGQQSSAAASKAPQPKGNGSSQDQDKKTVQPEPKKSEQPGKTAPKKQTTPKTSAPKKTQPAKQPEKKTE